MSAHRCASRTRSDRSSTPSTIGGLVERKALEARGRSSPSPSAPGSTITSNDGSERSDVPVHRLDEPGARERVHGGVIRQVVGDAPHADDLEVEQMALADPDREVLVVELLGSERGQREPVTGADAGRPGKELVHDHLVVRARRGEPPLHQAEAIDVVEERSDRGLPTTAMSKSVASLKPMKKFSWHDLLDRRDPPGAASSTSSSMSASDVYCTRCVALRLDSRKRS